MPSSNPGSSEQLDATIPGAFPDGDKSQANASTHQTLSQALHARRAEYTRPRTVRIKVGSWNVAAQKGTEQDIGGWFVAGKGIEEALAGLGVKGPKSESEAPRESVPDQEARRVSFAPTIPHNDDGSVPGQEDVGIYALGLQEIVDITSPAEALRPYTDPTVANRWKTALEAAMPEGYKLVAEQQLIGLLLLVYASPAVYPHVKSVSTTSVGTGLMGYMGNKGAVTARLVLGETTRLVFVNSHLAAGADKTALDRRNWDAAQINSRTRFEPITDSMGISQAHGEGLGEEDFAFWFGDLNYRLEGTPGDDVRRLLTIHTKDLDHGGEEEQEERQPSSTDSEYASKPSSDSDPNSGQEAVPLPPDLDPASLQTTLTSLLPHDELHQQQKAGKAFHDGWQEGPIRFLPSYKYDVGKVGVFDSSEKRRCPSWCDRILYRTRAGKQRYEAKIKEQEEARKRDEEMKAKGMDHAADDDDVLYNYDPDTDGDNNAHEEFDEYDENEDNGGNEDPKPEPVVTKEGFSDEILLEYYTAHMRVLSSDHKPLDAIFALEYDAVIPDLKAAIHQEVARELDRQENEGRPSITLVVDRATGSGSPGEKDKTDSSFDGVDFGDVQYAKSKKRNITIANTGRVPATFGFTDRPVAADQPEGPFPPWLTATFDREPDNLQKPSADNFHEQYTLEPADVCNAELKLKIDSIETVRSLNEGNASLDEILVLRVENGRDHFLPIRANWQQSALARSIDKLIKIPEGGIRKLQNQKPDRGEGVKWSVPRELFRLTEALEDLIERTLAEWDMTAQEGEKAPWQHNAGWPFVKGFKPRDHDELENALAQAYDALDCDSPFDAAFGSEVTSWQRVEILAEVLLVFLGSLQDGIITKSIWEKLEEGIATRERARQQLVADDEKIWALEILSATPNHNASFLLLTSMLQNIATQITEASKPKPDTPRASTDLPSSPTVSVRRKTLSKVPAVAIRQLIDKNYATVFADVMFRSTNLDKMKERDRAVRRERMIKFMELFLDEEGWARA
ncbi:DNase I-like protein [Corynespora cassiicola Philippines]|uniref:DNase I-like protein n=1 Tax=Corynespora cassiicola Philippines TaxID=1448308 RepID=A0A2T2P1R8_CORCC|nr:DNase I-like protein [Corynespora cassiicola Philippines]